MADVPVLTQALRDPDAGVRTLAEQSLWLVWGRSGDPEMDKTFVRGVEEMQRGAMAEAVETFTEVIRRKPDFAEGWNKRATAYFLLGEFEKSLADCDEVMKRNPVHFGALSGYGMIYLQLNKPEQALPYFERALAVNPNLTGIEQAVEAIKQLLEQQAKDTI
jgi:tetratricopeptide (TPR) repeat protein